MRRHIPGLHSGQQDLVSNLDGLFLVRVERVSEVGAGELPKHNGATKQRRILARVQRTRRLFHLA